MRIAKTELEFSRIAQVGIMRDRDAVVQPNWGASAQGQDDAQAQAGVVAEKAAVWTGIETERVGIDVADLIERGDAHHLDNGDAVIGRTEEIGVAAQRFAVLVFRADR